MRPVYRRFAKVAIGARQTVAILLGCAMLVDESRCSPDGIEPIQ
jgi:hypothetical protein